MEFFKILGGKKEKAKEEMIKGKQRAWDKKITELDKLADRIGHPIDAGIKEAIAALNLLGIPTDASCEGHTDHGLPYPWITIGASYDRPMETWGGQIDAYKTLAKKYNKSFEDVFYDGDKKIRREASELIEKTNPNFKKTKERLSWEKDRDKKLEKIHELLAGFYTQRDGDPYTDPS